MDTLLFNFHDVILMVTAYQCVLFALLLFLNRNGTLSPLLLALFLLTQAAIPMEILISFGAGFRDWAFDISPNLFYSFGVSYWLEGPLLLLYTRSLIYKNYSLHRKDLALFLPAVFFIAYISWTYWALGNQEKIDFVHSEANARPLSHQLVFLSREILRVVFGAMCLVEIHRCRTQLLNIYSNIEGIDFLWLKSLIIGFLIVRGWAVLVSLAIILSLVLTLNINYALMGLVANYSVFILISVLIFMSLSKSSNFEGLEAKGQDVVPAGQDKPSIDPEMVAQLEQHMNKEKPYLAPVLTLEHLAGQLSWTQRVLSNTINRHYEQNFFEFVNQYRIEEVKLLLINTAFKEKTVTELMLCAGFNSKATFNSHFKRHTGLTPSEYRKQNLSA